MNIVAREVQMLSIVPPLLGWFTQPCTRSFGEPLTVQFENAVVVDWMLQAFACPTQMLTRSRGRLNIGKALREFTTMLRTVSLKRMQVWKLGQVARLKD